MTHHTRLIAYLSANPDSEIAADLRSLLEAPPEVEALIAEVERLDAAMPTLEVTREGEGHEYALSDGDWRVAMLPVRYKSDGRFRRPDFAESKRVAEAIARSRTLLPELAALVRRLSQATGGEWSKTPPTLDEIERIGWWWLRFEGEDPIVVEVWPDEGANGYRPRCMVERVAEWADNLTGGEWSPCLPPSDVRRVSWPVLSEKERSTVERTRKLAGQGMEYDNAVEMLAIIDRLTGGGK
jgi:hypothetical protein